MLIQIEFHDVALRLDGDFEIWLYFVLNLSPQLKSFVLVSLGYVIYKGPVRDTDAMRTCGYAGRIRGIFDT